MKDNEQRKFIFVYIPAGIINGNQQYVINFTIMWPYPGIIHYAEILRIEIYPNLWNKTDSGEIQDNKDDSVLIINKGGDLEYIHIQDEF